MSITKVLSDKKIDSAEKLEAIAQIVAGAREAYGNSKDSIESPMVNTTNGSMSFVHLDDDSKVNQLRASVLQIKAQAVEFHSNTPGSNLNKKVEELVATHGMFVNINAGTKFEYI